MNREQGTAALSGEKMHHKGLTSTDLDREFLMTDRDFERIKDLAYTLTGIKLTDHKKNMIYGRLARRVRDLNMGGFSAYCDEITQKDSSETVHFVNSITTNLTSFFRENHHFIFLKETLIPQLIEKNRNSKRLRIWSAGCSTGEEPYSIAMVLKSFSELNSWDVKILATDLDSNVVEKASQAFYLREKVEKIPKEYERYLDFSGPDEHVLVKAGVSSLIRFKQLNLLHEWKMKGPFDFIFCRNVIIYFDLVTQRKLFGRVADLLAPHSFLFIGHSENLNNVSDRFTPEGRTIYRKLN